MSDAQTWSVIGLLAATFLGLFTDIRSQFRAMRQEMREDFRSLHTEIASINVVLARIDQKLTDHIEHHPGGVA